MATVAQLESETTLMNGNNGEFSFSDCKRKLIQLLALQKQREGDHLLNQEVIDSIVEIKPRVERWLRKTVEELNEAVFRKLRPISEISLPVLEALPTTKRESIAQHVTDWLIDIAALHNQAKIVEKLLAEAFPLEPIPFKLQSDPSHELGVQYANLLVKKLQYSRMTEQEKSEAQQRSLDQMEAFRQRRASSMSDEEDADLLRKVIDASELEIFDQAKAHLKAFARSLSDSFPK